MLHLTLAVTQLMKERMAMSAPREGLASIFMVVVMIANVVLGWRFQGKGANERLALVLRFSNRQKTRIEGHLLYLVEYNA